jgi:hypothetical protein
VIDIRIFQSQAIEIQRRVLATQQDLLAKVETIQNLYQIIDRVLKDISLREREVGAARVVFQEVVIAMRKKEVGSSSKLSILEQTIGNILLKAWERNISEGRERAKEVRNFCEETLREIDESLFVLDSKSKIGTLDGVDIAKHLLNIKENEEREQTEIT